MTGEKKMFTSYVKNKDSQDSIIFGDGNQGKVKGLGKIAISNEHSISNVFLVQSAKNLPAVQETWVQSLGWEDPPEKSTLVSLPGKSHGQRSLAGCSPWGCKESGTTE